MKQLCLVVAVVLVCALWAVPAVPSQSIKTDGNIETDAQLVSNVATGTAPLAVSSTTNVTNLNADLLDGVNKEYFVYYVDEFLPLMAQVEALSLQVNAAPVQLPETGQKTCRNVTGTMIPCTGTGQDGELRRGVEWPIPRFTDNMDETVTDNLTGLIWLRKANCILTDYPTFDNDGVAEDGKVTWQHALDFVADMNAGNRLFCSAGQNDWRLPNRFELESLLDLEFYTPALSNAAGTAKWTEGDVFIGVVAVASPYWTSTTQAVGPDKAWAVNFDDANVIARDKSEPVLASYLWPVRGGGQ